MGKEGILLSTIDTLYGKRKKEDGKDFSYTDKERDILGEQLFHVLMGDVGSSQQSKIRKDSHESADKHFQAVVQELTRNNYRDSILEHWKKRITKPINNFKNLCENILNDNLYLEITEGTNEYKIVEHLNGLSASREIEGQAQFLTTVTLMSITRHHWHEISKYLLPEYHTEHPVTKTTEEILFENGKKAYDEGKYIQAIDYFKNSWYEKEKNNDWNGNIFYMLACCYRFLRNDALEEDNGNLEIYSECYKENLTDACDYSNLDALLLMADELGDFIPNHAFDIAYEQSASYCKRIISLTELSSKNNSGDIKAKRGEAFWKLYRLINEGNYIPLEGECAEDYLKQAKGCGHPKATEQYIQNKENEYVSLTDFLDKSEDSSKGIMVVNVQNSIIHTIIQHSKPVGWKEVYVRKTGTNDEYEQSDLYIDKTRIFSSFKELMTKKHFEDQKYFLVNDDFNRNLSDFLEILQSVRDTYSSPSLNVEIYIRGREEKISPIVDTALSHVERLVCKVHIIDDDKIAARVLAKHPLFYSIRNIHEESKANLHYVIIGSTSCCQWLLREAFWMLTFRNKNIKTYITMIAPDAKETLNKIIYQCPGMEPSITEYSKRSEDDFTRNFPYIQAINHSYDSTDAIDDIRKIVNKDHAYFSIDIGDDIENMHAATRLREEILNIGIDLNNWEMINNTAITFKCKDPNVCVLSRHSIVLLENKGDSWNTNYAIIPFGSYEDYKWDELVNNLYDRVGFNNHLQYYYQDKTTIRKEDGKYQEAYTSFWGKTYNRDSSISVALSMPYRLFQVNYYEKGKIIPPADWKITDQTAYYSESAFLHFAEQYPKSDSLKEFYNEWVDDNGKYHRELNAKCHTLSLAMWEKERWNKFMLSRGWRSASERFVANYYSAGNPRHQLYIGKLHPCITTYDKLPHLESFWKGKTGTEKNFRQLDISNLEMTRSILQMEWTHFLEQETNKEGNEERK